MAIGTARTYRTLRLSAIGFLIFHLILRVIHPDPTVFSDLVIFNLVAICAGVITFYSPNFNDRLARYAVGWAIMLWALGSTITTWDDFYTPTIWASSSDICYALFYPLALFGLIRTLSAHQKFRSMDILDVIIITFGLSSVIAAVFLKSAMARFSGSSATVFLSIVYPVGDLVLLSIALILVFIQKRVLRSLLFLLGIAIFTATDIWFLYKSATTGYSFAALTDDGWLLGLILLAESMWHHGGEVRVSEKIVSAFSTLALVFSGGVLAVSALYKNHLPNIAIIPAIITVTLAILRMAMGRSDSKAALANFELSRIDDLTGLANRRRFLNEMAQLGEDSGTVLLLDLDGFKLVNDSLGHEAGDELLRQISLRFSRVIPSDALLARLGGDEFGLVIPGGVRHGLQIAQAISSTVSYPFLIDSEEVIIGVSIGRVINDGSADLLSRADSAMYEAKRTGGGICLWQP